MAGTLKEFIRSRTFLWNLVAALVFVLAVFLFMQHWLSSYTLHGESISVPDLRGLKIDKAETFLRDKNLRFAVVDSIFNLDQEPGVILEQDPSPNSKVKEHRTIYLSINASLPPMIKMPDLVDVSLRQAEAILQSNGLKTGNLVYRPDLAKNAVLAQLYKGSEIRPGSDISKGSVIDLVLGDGLGNTMVSVPNLVSLTKSEALFVLKASSLTIGSVYFDEDVKNPETAKVYRQNPSYSDSTNIAQGQSVDIYLK